MSISKFHLKSIRSFLTERWNVTRVRHFFPRTRAANAVQEVAVPAKLTGAYQRPGEAAGSLRSAPGAEYQLAVIPQLPIKLIQTAVDFRLGKQLDAVQAHAHFPA